MNTIINLSTPPPIAFKTISSNSIVFKHPGCRFTYNHIRRHGSGVFIHSKLDFLLERERERERERAQITIPIFSHVAMFFKVASIQRLHVSMKSFKFFHRAYHNIMISSHKRSFITFISNDFQLHGAEAVC